MENNNYGNIILLSLILFFAVICNSNSQEITVTKEQLSRMNRVQMPSYIDTCKINYGHNFKILIVGNSITHHPVLEEIGWNYASGMAASKIQNDYAHILFGQIASLMPEKKICMRISNLASFERNFQKYDFKALDSLVAFNADVIVFQLGENVSFDTFNTPHNFSYKYVELINYIKGNHKPIVICTTPFFPSLIKNEIIKRVALQTNSFLADLSHLVLLDKENYAKNDQDYLGDKSMWNVGGIGAHPGDIGMKNISMQIFLNLNAGLNLKIE